MRPGLLRGVVVALTIEAFILFAAVGACAAHAHAAAAQTEVDRTAAWLTRTLHRPIADRTVTTQKAGEMTVTCGGRRCDAYVPFTHPNQVVTTARITRAWTRIRRDPMGPEAGYLLIHELLHTHDLSADDYGDGWVEEGIVDAVTLDLYPAWMAWRLPATWAVMWGPAYPRQVAAIRAASAKATGSRSWRTRQARIWRRQLLQVDAAGRQMMLEAANSDPRREGEG